MYGDYSRGHQPDRKRGRSYRRVLLQMGRPVLDSDVAASVDALLGETRTAMRGLGCQTGSPDLGFLVTPGRLVAVFAELALRLRVVSGSPTAWIDYRHRYLDRYPALYVAGSGGQSAVVSVPPVQRLISGGSGRVGLWARVEQPVSIAVNGFTVNLAPSATGLPVRTEFSVGAALLDPVEVRVPAEGEVWLFLLEADEAAGTSPVFWAAPGTYHADGLVVDARGGGAFPSVAFPETSGFPWADSPPPDPPLDGILAPAGMAAGTRLVAYLEVHERHITHIEDPGIREEALGAGDTATRTQLVGQVKVATLSDAIPSDVEPAAAAIRRAFSRVDASGGQLTIAVPEASPITDPCGVPTPAGYSGADNRLYRIEVHHGGGLAQLRLKWSRDNGSELFEARLDESENLVFDAGTRLAAGDFVEVLSHVTDLGDQILGRVTPAGLEPPIRAVGQLAQLAAVESSSSTDEVAFTLVDPDDASLPVALDRRRYGDLPEAVLKVRRWHGIIDPRLAAGGGPPSTGPHALEDGITLELSGTGSFLPGQYWQYEARVRRDNANGPWRPEPHGPERRYAPLALLEFRGDPEPLMLLAWLDERFSSLCDLDADSISFDGRRVGSPSDTVQEALEELFEQGERWPTVAEDGINWTNDRVLPFGQFSEGLRVTFSEEMHPSTASPATFIVTLEVPDEEGVAGLRRLLVVEGRVDVDGLNWTFVPTPLDATRVGGWVRDLSGPLRCRVRLSANAILDRAGVRPLDGDTVGRLDRDGYDTFINLTLPSGDGVRGGDFESWFYLTAPPPRAAVESVDPAPGATFAPGTGPGSIQVSFSDMVDFGTLSNETFTVSVRHSSERTAGEGRRIPGRILPYPFETNPRAVWRMTFVPDDPEALRPTEAPTEEGSWIFTIRARGQGDNAIRDMENRSLDGAGVDGPSDFVSTFSVRAVRPQ